MTERLHGFDLLRGLCALTVAIYHLLFWQEIADLNMLGSYSVNIFFVLSGASMYIAYADKLAHGMSLSTFIGRRFFRLAPLYWLLVLIKGRLLSRVPKLLLNLSFLFGLANPGATSMLTGGWSLGIEFVFYFLFPIFLLSLGGKWRPFALMGMLLWIQIYFTGSVLQKEGDMGKYWDNYVQFISFIAYFYGGCLVGKMISSPLKPPAAAWIWFLAMLASLGYLTSLAVDTDMAGLSGTLLAMLCILVVFVAGYLRVPAGCVWLATLLGNMSYGLYLLHPYIYIKAVKFDLLNTNDPVTFTCLVMVISITLAVLLERYYERKIRRFGYAWLDRKTHDDRIA